MNSPSDIITKILVEHTAFTEAVKRIESCFEFAEGSHEPICIAIIGESRTGKSRALETCFLKHPPVRADAGLIVPILKIKAPSKPTVKSLIEVMLDGLGAPDSQRGTENEKTRRLKILLCETQTRMVIIDEFQHFVDRGTRVIMHHAADWLKILVDDMKCALVVGGLPSCQAVIEANEQLAGRFLSPLRMSRFSWHDIGQRREFKKILRSFHANLRKDFDIPEFHADDMAFRFWCATGGLIGYLTKLLRELMWEFNLSGTKRIQLTDLDSAHSRSVWDTQVSHAPRPFSSDFQVVPTPELLQTVNRIGTSAAPVEPTSRRRRNKIAHTSASEVLSTR